MGRKKRVKPLPVFPSLSETGPVIIKRESWGGKTELKCTARTRRPVRFVFMKTIEQTPLTEVHQTCARRLLWLQNRHRERGSRSDIRYNFIVGSDGYIYEGRGWDYRPDLEGRNWCDYPDMIAEDILGESMSSKSLFIGFFDTPDDETAVENMIRAKHALIDFGVNNFYIAKVHKIYQLYPSMKEYS